MKSVSGGQELVFAHDDPLTGLQVERSDVARGVAAERDLARGLGLEQEQRHPAEIQRRLGLAHPRAAPADQHDRAGFFR